jgi:hypothetical protein
MLLDTLNIFNNFIIGLSHEIINRCNAETVVTAPVANGIATPAPDIPEQDLTNYLFAIPFEVDSIHMEGFTRSGNEVTWIKNGIVLIT